MTPESAMHRRPNPHLRAPEGAARSSSLPIPPGWRRCFSVIHRRACSPGASRHPGVPTATLDRPGRSRGLTALLVTFAVALGACKSNRPGQAELPPATGSGAAPAPKLPSIESETEGKAATVAVATSETTGTTFPRARAEVSPPLSGVIASIAVAEGDRVAKGAVLFRLRTVDLSLGVEQARAAAAAAAVNLASVQTEHDRARRLFEQKAVEQAQLDRVTAQLEAARSAVAAAEVGVARARQVMSDAVVRSPIDGVVTHKVKSAGEMATMMPPTVVVVVEDHAVLELRFRVPEQRLTALAVDQPVSARFDSVGQTRAARVVRIAPSVDPVTRTVEVVALIDNPDGALKSGMLATITAAPTGEAAAPPGSTAAVAPPPTPPPVRARAVTP
jgi:RND family efflux transporter MFP subunit